MKKTLTLKVEGEAGSGKTTFLWYLSRVLASKGYEVEKADEHALTVTFTWTAEPPKQ